MGWYIREEGSDQRVKSISSGRKHSGGAESRAMTKEQNKDLIRYRKGIYNGFGNDFRRGKKDWLIRKMEWQLTVKGSV